MDAYHKTCPLCGGQLVANLAGPEIPPWRCDPCFTSYWVAELSQEARAAFRPAQRDFGHLGSTSHQSVREQVALEHAEARARGVSLRHEQLGLFRRQTLLGLLKAHPRMAQRFAREIEAAQ